MKEVIDEYGQKTIVDDEHKKLYAYNNKKKEIIYNAEVIVDGAKTGFFTNYAEVGIVTDISLRLRMWNNSLLLAYADSVGFDADKNDPEKEIWKDFCKKVEENQDKFFDKNGDFRKRFLIDPKELLM